MNSKMFVAWKTVHPDELGNCTIRLGAGANMATYSVLKPLDKSDNGSGKFPCGREQTSYEGKNFKLPLNMSCDDCTLQLEFQTKASGSMYMCSDIQILSGNDTD